MHKPGKLGKTTLTTRLLTYNVNVYLISTIKYLSIQIYYYNLYDSLVSFSKRMRFPEVLYHTVTDHGGAKIHIYNLSTKCVLFPESTFH